MIAKFENGIYIEAIEKKDDNEFIYNICDENGSCLNNYWTEIRDLELFNCNLIDYFLQYILEENNNILGNKKYILCDSLPEYSYVVMDPKGSLLSYAELLKQNGYNVKILDTDELEKS